MPICYQKELIYANSETVTENRNKTCNLMAFDGYCSNPLSSCAFCEAKYCRTSKFEPACRSCNIRLRRTRRTTGWCEADRHGYRQGGAGLRGRQREFGLWLHESGNENVSALPVATRLYFGYTDAQGGATPRVLR